MKKKRLPIGTSDYKRIVDDNLYYVDKTMLIKEVIDGGEVILITRPRRFGKTLNQTTLKHFFEKSNEDTSYMFKDKKIWQYEEYREMQGKFPVIYLTLKDVQGKDYDQTIKDLKQIVAAEYSNHLELIKSEKLNQNDKDKISKISRGEGDLTDYKFSLKTLSMWLHQHYGEKAVIIIDEYDTPIIESYQKGYYDEFIQFIKTFLGAALKDNYSLERSVVTGITKVAKESIFSDLNNLLVATILTPFFTKTFGLLKEEVHEALNYYELSYEENRVI